jgi:glycosyltransferase involved in cell wall biosynthesis
VRVVLLGGGVQPIPPTGYGGVERFLDDLRTALEGAGVEVAVVNRVRHRRTRDEIPFALEVPRRLRRERYDVVHAHTPVVANRLALGGFPFVYTSHSRHWYYRDRWSHQWGYWLERRAVRQARATIALTEPLARTMRAAVPSAAPLPISVVPVGVDAEAFRPDWTARTGRRALGVGVVLPFKRWEWAAAALRGTGVSLRLAGPTPSSEYAAKVRAAGDSVELLGEVDEPTLRRLYAESDVLLHPSSVELLSGVVLQGLASGLPVLGGPALDGAYTDGRSGWVVPDRDPAAFLQDARAHVRELVGDDAARHRMGEAARAEAIARYSWPKIVEGHLAVYRRVTG